MARGGGDSIMTRLGGRCASLAHTGHFPPLLNRELRHEGRGNIVDPDCGVLGEVLALGGAALPLGHLTLARMTGLVVARALSLASPNDKRDG
jgi:hypothetical protein